jgi:heat shock protein HtpX
MNNIKVFVLMAGMAALLAAIGGAFGGPQGALIGFLVAAVSNFAMYFSSASMVLRAYRAQVVSPQEAPDLYSMVDRLRQNADLPMPSVAIAPHRQPNAFATGRNPSNSVVCVTQGLLELLSKDEIEGVLSHELAHVKNRDMLLQTFSATMAGAISNLAQFAYFTGGSRSDSSNPAAGPLMMIFGPMAAMLIQFAISRQREYEADRVGAQICGRPLALASALSKLDQAARQIPMNISPALAPLAQINPLSAFGGIARLFSTHPPTEERIARLQAMANQPQS